jgi:hypothetical protein
MATKHSTPNPNIVSADPAKGFFVSMLIKDITLRDAIGDLVDNAVDAIKAKANGSNHLKGYEIDIKLGKSYFSISDNGSGMESDIARKYAFNFGKSDSHKLIDMSIGQFGIGMKRAFFKLGNNILVKSIAKTSQFELKIDVLKWLKKPKKWEFEFEKGTLKERISNSNSKTGLFIHISNLSDDSKLSFGDRTFIETLIKEISLEHMLNINKGLIIKINEHSLTSDKISLVNDNNIRPTFWEKASKGINVKVIAGISTKDEEDGGWYIFCNDRLIIGKNKTNATVWTGKKGDGVPLWHAQYHRFRGYVFFNANDSSMLPWNTTKTGMDMDSPYYKEVRSKMINMTRQVMELLDKLKEEKEKDNPEENQKLNRTVDKSLKIASSVTNILSNTKNLDFKFHFPIELFTPPRKKNTVKISYQVSNEKYEAAKQNLDVKTPKEVGLKTFNYYFNNEL